MTRTNMLLTVSNEKIRFKLGQMRVFELYSEASNVIRVTVRITQNHIDYPLVLMADVIKKARKYTGQLITFFESVTQDEFDRHIKLPGVQNWIREVVPKLLNGDNDEKEFNSIFNLKLRENRKYHLDTFQDYLKELKVGEDIQIESSLIYNHIRSYYIKKDPNYLMDILFTIKD